MNNHNLNKSEAQQALSNISNNRNTTMRNLKTPSWLAWMMSICAGFAAYSSTLVDKSSMWTLLSVLSAGLLILGASFYFFWIRQKGYKLSRSMVSTKRKLNNVLAALVVAAAILVSKQVVTQGFTFVSWGIGILMFAITFYALSNYVNGERLEEHKNDH